MLTRRGVVLLVIVFITLFVAGCGPATDETPAAPTVTAGSPAGPSAAGPGPTPTARPTPGITLEVALGYVQRFEGATLARVNGVEITWEDYEPALVQTLRTLTQGYEINWDDAAIQERLGDLQFDVLEQVVDHWLLRQIAAEQGLLTEAEKQERLDVAKSQILSSGQYADWDAYLQSVGLTNELFERMFGDSLVLATVMRAQDVPHEEEQVHLAHITVTDEAVAKAVATELRAGRDFEEIAAQYSMDTSTKDTGGDIGWVTRGGLPPEIEQAAFSLAPGQFSDPIQVDEEYVIILVLEREVRELDTQLLQQRQSVALEAQLAAKRAEAVIEYLVDFGTGRGAQD